MTISATNCKIGSVFVLVQVERVTNLPIPIVTDWLQDNVYAEVLNNIK